MKNIIKRYNVSAYILLVSMLFTLVALIMYCVNMSTGYAAGSSPNGWGVTCFVLALLIEVCCLVFATKLPSWCTGLALFVVGILLTVSTTIWVMGIVNWAANVWLIPNNDPPAEVVSLWTGIWGIIILSVGYILLIAASAWGSLLWTPKPEQEELTKLN